MRLLITIILLSSFAVQGQENKYQSKIDALLEKGSAYYGIQKDSGQFYFKKIAHLGLLENDTLTVLDILITSNRHLGYFYDLNTIRENLQKIDQLANEESPFFQEFDDPLLYPNSIRADKGNYFFKLGNYAKAKSYFEDIRNSYLEKLPESLDIDHFQLLSNSLSFLAKIYYDENKFDQAKDYYNQVITLIKKVTPEDLNSLYINYALLAEVYTEQGDFKIANSYLQLTLKYALKKNNNPNRILSVAHNLVDNYIALSEKDSINTYLSLMENHLDRSPSFKEVYYRTKAKLALRNNNTEAALKQIELALSVLRQQSGQKNNATLANIYLEKGNILLFSKNYKNALTAANQGLEILPEKFGNSYLELMDLKTSTLLNLKKFRDVNTASLSAVSALDNLKLDYQYSSDKINLIEKTFPLFESALEANYLLHKKTGKIEYAEKAFFFMEKSKSVLLLEALMAAKAEKFAKVPDTLLEKERSLRIDITALEKESRNESKKKEELQRSIFDLTEQKAKLLNSMSVEYPEYYSLRYGIETIDLPSIKNELDDDELLISYFYGNKAIYSIAVDKNSYRMKKLKVNENLENKLKTVQLMLSNSKSDIDSLSRATHELYSMLLEPLIVNNKATRLTVITDGLLNYIPFSALNIMPNGLTYLAENYAISYANSATLLKELKSKKQPESKLLAFAPWFNSNIPSDDTRSGVLGNLPHNREEVKRIAKSIKGDSFLDDQATLQNFTANVSNHSIIHLATHAVFDDENPEYSYLAFTPIQNEEDVLPVKDLYNLSLNASLVTLSACESSIGELKRGEGFLSLARGFFYSGASSIASTLWKVNDNSSSEIMGSFYENLADGKTKDRSLQEAKLSFLKKNKDNGLSHPYYWSGYIIQGNIQALEKSLSLWWYLLGGAFLIIFFVNRKRLFQRFQ